MTKATTSKNTVSIGGLGSANNIFIDNSNDGEAATNTVSLGGTANLVTLNGDATNKVTFITSGGNEAVIGFSDDDLFGNKSTVTFAGTGNLLLGGDENFTVSGSTGTSSVEVGDGNNSITTGGGGNFVSVWGGNNNINAGGGILRQDPWHRRLERCGEGAIDPDDAPVPLSPTDNVTIAGAG